MATIKDIGDGLCDEVATSACPPPLDCWDEDGEEGIMDIEEQIKIAGKKTGQWAIAGDGGYDYVQEVKSIMPAGVYQIDADMGRGIHFDPMIIEGDKLMPLPDPHTVRVLQSLEEFWTKEDLFREFGFLWTRGILLYGPPGSGKTSTIRRASDLVVAQDGVVFYVYNVGLAQHGVRLFRKAEPKRKIIVILEDIDRMINRGDEEELLSLLDGENQVDNVVYLATTNDLADIPPRIRNRPRRFDDLVEIGMPDEDVRRSYFQIKNPRFADGQAAEDLETWVKVTEGLSVSHLCEMIVAVELLNHDPIETGARLQFMKYLADEDLEKAVEMVEEFLEQAIQTSNMKARQIARMMISRAQEMSHEVREAEESMTIDGVKVESGDRIQIKPWPIDFVDSAMGG